MMKIAIGCDHVGIILKSEVTEHLKSKGITVIDKGAYEDVRTDYPVYGKAVAEAVVAGEADLGIVFCGSGVGISIAANKVNGIRAVVCSEPYSAKLSREHNNTNVLSFGTRVIGSELAKMIIDAWLEAEFQGERHQKRVEMITAIEEEQA
ncbi:ribose 5-phosphate isomerase B [Enterobacter hormaechei subsp. hormaechei]|uniref:ribose 5-phosphate isomerase B n=1 Tax=Enterobacteriaceae TaxID=543 RepID=UPI001FF29BB5|nr:ribose 5-phosphate isomerase B [Klebsiella pneumoniae]MCK0975344.1 ribose 5-phosphate isomerase B [Klebsiella pneumoniae]MDX7254225.1 ribose 5-phosphate isomerase B [Klebsiella pneumoniae]